MILMPLSASAYPQGEFGPWPFPDSVDELPNETHPGKPFNGFPNYQRTIDWMAIPEWLAGDWLSKDYRVLKSWDHRKQFLTTIPRGTVAPIADHFGDQVDSQGTIWSCNITPFMYTIPLQNFANAQLTIAMKPLEIRADGVALWQRVYHVIYDPNNQSIFDSYTEERVTEFAPSGDNMITAKSTSRFYDENGNATSTTNSVRLMRRTTAFKPLGERLGVNLPISLSEHLQATGRGDLVSQ